MQAHRVSRGIALLFLGHRHSRLGWGGQPHTPATSSPGKDPVCIVLEAGWEPFNIYFNANLKFFLRLSKCASVGEKILIRKELSFKTSDLWHVL